MATRTLNGANKSRQPSGLPVLSPELWDFISRRFDVRAPARLQGFLGNHPELLADVIEIARRVDEINPSLRLSLDAVPDHDDENNGDPILNVFVMGLRETRRTQPTVDALVDAIVSPYMNRQPAILVSV